MNPYKRVLLRNSAGVYWRGDWEAFDASNDNPEEKAQAAKLLDDGQSYQSPNGWTLELDYSQRYYISDERAKLQMHFFLSDEEAVNTFEILRRQHPQSIILKLYKEENKRYFVFDGKWIKIIRSRSYTDFQTSLKDAISGFKFYKGTAHDFSMMRIRLKLRFNILDREWAWADGYLDRVWDELYRTDLIFGYEVDGQIFEQKWDLMPEAHKELARQNKLNSSHYWLVDGKISNKRW